MNVSTPANVIRGIVCFLAMSSVVFAQDLASDPNQDSVVTTDVELSQEIPPPQTRVAAGIVVIAGIAFLGIGLLLLVVFLGHRLRKLARKPLPRQSHLDEFWYLRPKQQLGENAGESVASEDDFERGGESNTDSFGETDTSA